MPFKVCSLLLILICETASSRQTNVIHDNNSFSVNFKNWKLNNQDCVIFERPEYISVSGAVVCVNNCNFCDYVSSTSGGAIFLGSGPTQSFYGSNIIQNCQFINCVSPNGGAIYISQSSNSISNFQNCSFNVNHADYDGGAVYIHQSNSNFTKCKFTRNYISFSTSNVTLFRGGSIFILDSQVELEECYFDSNFATLESHISNSYVSGGAIYIEGLFGLFEKCTFLNNYVSLYGSTWSRGGAIVFTSTEGTLHDCSFVNNSAFIDENFFCHGGSILFFQSNLSVTDCTFQNNSLLKPGMNSLYGGAICIFYSSGTVSGCNFSDNNSKNGGDIHLESSNKGLSVINCEFKRDHSKNTLTRTIFSVFADSLNNRNRFIDNRIYIENPGSNLLVFGSLYYVESIWDCANNCIFPYDSSLFKTGSINLMDESKNSLSFGDVFQRNCITPTEIFSPSFEFTATNEFKYEGPVEDLEFDDDNKHAFSEKKTEKFKLNIGLYFIECFGAQGGQGYFSANSIGSDGGKGAYASGILVHNDTYLIFYATVGGRGAPNDEDSYLQNGRDGGYNGGGSSSGASSHNDMGGGGGGATDIRVGSNDAKDRIIVAAGGSGGASFANGAPGGTVYSLCVDTDNSSCSDDENNHRVCHMVFKNSTKAAKDENGEDGLLIYGKIPGSGAGAGYFGGLKNSVGAGSQLTSYKSVSCSGSSYISGHPELSPHTSSISFLLPVMISGLNEGDGKIVITKLSDNLDPCTKYNEGKECTQCVDKFFVYEGICVESCPKGTNIENGKCEKQQTSPFSYSNIFSNSVVFSRSFYFSESEKFSQTNDFTKSAYFTSSSEFPQTNDFSKSAYFTASSEFSLFNEISSDSSENQDFESSLKAELGSTLSDISSSETIPASDFTESTEYKESTEVFHIPSKDESSSIDYFESTESSNSYSSTNKESHETISTYFDSNSFTNIISYSMPTNQENIHSHSEKQTKTIEIGELATTTENTFDSSFYLEQSRETRNKGGMSKGALIGIIVGCIVLILLATSLAIFLYIKKKSNKEQRKEEITTQPTFQNESRTRQTQENDQSESDEDEDLDFWI